MGDTLWHTRGHRLEVPHALEGNVTHERENSIHRRFPARDGVNHGALPTIRHLPQDRLYMD